MRLKFAKVAVNALSLDVTLTIKPNTNPNLNPNTNDNKEQSTTVFWLP